MTFLNFSLFAAGAGAISIPIIIHFLFRRRRKPVVWAAMRFLFEAVQRRRRRLQLEQWLLLALRCLLLLLVALALGRPAAESAAQALGLTGGRTVYILLDDSLASSLTDTPGDTTVVQAGAALDRHKSAAHRLLDSLGPGDRAALITLSTPAQSRIVPASADLAGVASLIDELQPTEARADFAGALAAAGAAMKLDQERNTSPVIVMLSEFRLGSADLAQPLSAILRDRPSVRLSASRPASTPVGNVQIVSVETLRRIVLARDAAGAAALDARVRLRRTGFVVGRTGVSEVRLAIEHADGSASAPVSSMVRWQAGQSETDLLLTAPGERFAEGGAAVRAWVDRDSIEGDNQFVRPIEVRSAVRVGMAARRRFGGLPSIDALQPEDWLRIALAPTDRSPIEVIDVDPGAIDAPTLAGLDAIMIPRPDLMDDSAWRRLGAFVRNGGLVFITPPAEATVHLWSDSMASALGVPWRLEREATPTPDGLSLQTEGERASLLEMISSELGDLARSVRVTKSLGVIEGAQAAGSRVLVTLENGAPWLLVGAPADDGAETETNMAPARGSSGSPDIGRAPRSTPDSDRDNSEAEAGMSRSRGLVIYLASAPTLSWTDLPARPLMVPLVQELIRQGVGEAMAGGTFRAGARILAPPRTAELERLLGLEGPDVRSNEDRSNARFDGRDARPATRTPVAETGLSDPIRTAGLFRALDRQGAARGLLAVNADTDAGQTDVQESAAVREWLLGTGAPADSFTWIEAQSLASEGVLATASGEGGALSYPLLIAAALVAVIELILARLFSHASGVLPHGRDRRSLTVAVRRGGAGPTAGRTTA